MRFTGMLLSNADGTELTLRLNVQDQQEYEITLSAEMAQRIMLALGRDALHLRGENPKLSVLATSGYVDEDELAAFNFDGFLHKPFTLAKLRGMVEGTLAAAKVEDV